MEPARTELSEIDPDDRAAFARVLGSLAISIDSGEILFSINQGRVSDTRVTRRTHVPQASNLSAALDALMESASRKI